MKKYYIILVIAISIISCKDPFENEITPAYENVPVATYLDDNPDVFSQWDALLNHTGLHSTMNLNANYTCFIPDNDAVNAYLTANGYGSVSDIPVEEAAYLVKYHTIQGKQYTQSQFDNGAMADSTATGDYLTIEIRAGGINSIYINGEALVKQFDIELTNGTVHVLGSVLNPITETIWDKLNNSNYSIFAEATELTGLSEELNKIYETVINSETNQRTTVKRFFTLFAVPDDVFNENGISDLNGLISFLEAGNDYTSGGNALYKYVAYHIIDQQLDYTSLTTFSSGDNSKNVSTMAENGLINFTGLDDQLYLNINSARDSGTFLTEYNINVKNGIIHNLDGLLTIMSPPQTTVIWELTDYSELAAMFPNTYRKTSISSTTTKTIPYGSVNCYTWSATPAGNNDFAVSYVIAYIKSNAVLYTAINHDCLELDLGLYGWIDLESPPIVEGNYTVNMYYYSPNSVDKRGKISAIFDGEYLGSEISTHGASTTTPQMVKTTIGDVSLSGTTTHNIRLLAGDYYPVYIDYIEFVPID